MHMQELRRERLRDARLVSKHVDFEIRMTLPSGESNRKLNI